MRAEGEFEVWMTKRLGLYDCMEGERSKKEHCIDDGERCHMCILCKNLSITVLYQRHKRSKAPKTCSR
jgi:hypothetical protein